MTEAFPWDTAPRYLLRDRDASYGQSFRDRVQAMGIKEVVTAPRSPWQNAYIERLIGSIRRDCLNHVIIFDERHLRRVLSSYFNIIIRREHISRSIRIVRNPVLHTRPPRERLLPSHRSVDCIIATNAAPPELYCGQICASSVKDRFVLQPHRSNAIQPRTRARRSGRNCGRCSIRLMKKRQSRCHWRTNSRPDRFLSRDRPVRRISSLRLNAEL